MSIVHSMHPASVWCLTAQVLYKPAILKLPTPLTKRIYILSKFILFVKNFFKKASDGWNRTNVN